MRLQATHFVEVWKGESGKVRMGPMYPISQLKKALISSEVLGETIAIFKICPRNRITIIKEDQIQIDHTKIINHE